MEAKFENLEKEKETLYLEMKEESERHRISAKEEMKVMKETNENMVKCIRNLKYRSNIGSGRRQRWGTYLVI